MSAPDAFLDALASREATPGGGSAAALVGAAGAALTSMVCRLTLGRKKFADVEAQVAALLARSEKARADLQAAMAEDEAAFRAVMAAYGLDRADPARGDAIEAALRLATEAPLRCARVCADVVGMAEAAAAIGNPTVLSDAGVSALAAGAALRAARLNVLVNVRLMRDRAWGEAALAEVDRLVAECRDAAVAAAVAARL